jgi:hypothetical protein
LIESCTHVTVTFTLGTVEPGFTHPGINVSVQTPYTVSAESPAHALSTKARPKLIVKFDAGDWASPTARIPIRLEAADTTRIEVQGDKPGIVDITMATLASRPKGTPESVGLSPDTIAAIIVPIVGVLLIAGLIFFTMRRDKALQAKKEEGAKTQ